jgi:hypothetical protein
MSSFFLFLLESSFEPGFELPAKSWSTKLEL